MSSPYQAPVFNLLQPGEGGGVDLFGVWGSASIGVTEEAFRPDAISFALPNLAPEGEEVTIWRAVLPEDTTLAMCRLQEGEQRIEQAWERLPEARGRMQDFFAGSPKAGVDEEAFRLGGAYDGLPAAEQELAVYLLEAGQEVSFFPGEEKLEDARKAYEEFTRFVEQVRGAMSSFAQVESFQGSQVIGRTRVGWLGDIDTLWDQGLGAGQAALHAQNLRLAVEARAAWLRMSYLVIRAAFEISLLVSSSPAGAALAIPRAYQYIKQILEEKEKLETGDRRMAAPA